MNFVKRTAEVHKSQTRHDRYDVKRALPLQTQPMRLLFLFLSFSDFSCFIDMFYRHLLHFKYTIKHLERSDFYWNNKKKKKIMIYIEIIDNISNYTNQNIFLFLLFFLKEMGHRLRFSRFTLCQFHIKLVELRSTRFVYMTKSTFFFINLNSFLYSRYSKIYTHCETNHTIFDTRLLFNTIFHHAYKPHGDNVLLCIEHRF